VSEVTARHGMSAAGTVIEHCMTIDISDLSDAALADGLTLPLAIDPAAADLLFREAHTVYDFDGTPVDDASVAAAFELLRWGPTAFNSSPLRLLLVRSPEARERLVDHMGEGNKAKTASAGLTIVAAADTDFHEHLGTLAPHMVGAPFEQDAQVRESIARTSALIQVGYLIVALRATGLHVGPMAGFDAAGVDQEFFSENGWRTLLVLNVGQPARSEGATRPRAARLSLAQASRTV